MKSQKAPKRHSAQEQQIKVFMNKGNTTIKKTCQLLSKAIHGNIYQKHNVPRLTPCLISWKS